MHPIGGNFVANNTGQYTSKTCRNVIAQFTDHEIVLAHERLSIVGVGELAPYGKTLANVLKRTGI